MNSEQNSNQFELHSFPTMQSAADTTDTFDFSALNWRDDQRQRAGILALDFANAPAERISVSVNRDLRELRTNKATRRAVAEFHLVQRRFGPALAMIPRESHVLVNGVPSLSVHVLSARDSLVLAPGIHTYVTQRVRPYLGPPTEEMLKQKQRCPCCRIPLDKETQVVTCRCGVAYHRESAESHPDVAEEDRLNCFEQIRVCLSCKRPLSLKESLVWDPSTK